MSTRTVERKPAQFAEQRFRARKRAWLRRVGWVLVAGALLQLALFAGLGLLIAPNHMELFWDSASVPA